MLISKLCKIILGFALLVILFSPNPAYAESKSVTFCGTGNSYYDKGQYDLAITNYTKAIALNPQYAKAYCNRGLAYYIIKKNPLAINDFTKAIEVNPQYADAYKYRGMAYYAAAEYDLAVADFNKAIALNPQNEEAYFYRGMSHRSMGGGNEMAAADFTRAIAFNPQNIDYYLMRADVYEGRHKYLAVEDYNHVLRVEPGNSKAVHGKSMLFLVSPTGQYGIYDPTYNPFPKDW
jgi:tetratricopeptide (TPR) repeat protein